MSHQRPSVFKALRTSLRDWGSILAFVFLMPLEPIILLMIIARLDIRDWQASLLSGSVQNTKY